MTNTTWGGRFSKPLDKLAVKFNASILFDHILYKYDILGSKTHVKMLAKQKLVSEDEAKKIIQALAEIEKELTHNVHKLDETAEDIHMFIEQLLINKVGDIGKKLHTGRSRNDQVALDLRLYIRESVKTIKELVTILCIQLSELSNIHTNNMMPGYTHLQQAQPISLGKYFDAYLSMFNRDISRIDDWYKRMNFCPLGAGALAGSSLPLDRKFVAQELDFNGIVENTVDAVSDRDYIIEFCSIASIIMMHLSRLSEDLIIWSTQEFNFLTLDDAFATGSSLMPNKKNPDILELIRGKTGRTYGHLLAILTIMKALPLAYNKDMQEDKEGLFDTVNTLQTCLEIITPFINSIKFNTDIMHNAANSGYLNATAILEELVLGGMTFRDAHHQVGNWVAEANVNKCSLREVVNKYKNK